MCGICGYVGIRDPDLLERMTAALTHRGPDGEGFFRHEDIGLGHRRLSIIDVRGGQQPIENEDGSIVLICNGEVYNYAELRRELIGRGHQFRTKSDNEVILHLYEECGAECVQRLNGMFAFAIYDLQKQTLLLARDRIGIKPLYYVEHGKQFLFASEFKSILRHADIPLTLNHDAINDYLYWRYSPGPGGMFNELRKVPAGHYLTVCNGTVKLTRYWQPECFAGPFSGTDSDYQDQFAELFERSVERRLMSEVPLGVFLSGGVDSGAIVAAMARTVSHPIRTFTVGFDYEFDELANAADVAQKLGCHHTEIACSASDIALLPEIVYHLDQPLGDAIVIPMYLLAREARRHVTVVLTGDGADETLGGYLFHRVIMQGIKISRVVPEVIRRWAMAPAVAATPSSLINLGFDYPASLGQRGKHKVADFVRMMGPKHIDSAYRHLISLFDDRDLRNLYSSEFQDHLNGRVLNHAQQPGAGPYLNQLIHLQFADWLQDNILTKQDKLSMAHAVEVRVPFLDHELVEHALRFPPHLKLHGGRGKVVLRQYAQRQGLDKVAARRKQPFFVPIEKQVAEPAFRDLVDDTLSEHAVGNRGLFRPAAVTQLCKKMYGGEFMLVKQVFSLVMLELWMRMAVDRRGTV